MAATVEAKADGVFDAGDGLKRDATAELSRNGLAIIATSGEQLALWSPRSLQRTMAPGGFRIGAPERTGAFTFDPVAGSDLIRALAAFPEPGAPAKPSALTFTMTVIVTIVLVALVALAWGFFGLAEWLTKSGAA